MKRVASLIIALVLVMSCTSLFAFANSEVGSLDDLVSGQPQEVTGQSATQDTSNTSGLNAEQQTKNQNFIAGLNMAADMTTPVTGVNEANEGIKTITSFVVQILCYALTVLLTLRVVIDLVYIGIPFTRGFLGNGFAGNPQQGGMGGMQGGMGMGAGMGGMGMGGMRSGYGMGGMGMGAGMGGMGMNPGGANQGANMMGKIQWVSNQALNAVAQESNIGPDGKTRGALRTYISSMVVVMVLVPVLITLALTGVLTQLGFMLGSVIAEGIATLGNKI